MTDRRPTSRPAHRARRRHRLGRPAWIGVVAMVALVAAAVVLWPSAGDAAVAAHGIRVSGSATPASPAAGRSSTLTATVRGGRGRPAIVDLEVYDAAGAKAYQRYWSTTLPQPGDKQSFHTQWTPPAPGTYRLAVGVFTPDWATLLVWNNAAASVVAPPSPTPTTPVPTTVPPTTAPPTTAPPASGSPTTTPPTSPPSPTTTSTAPTHFGTLGPAATLPSDEQCAAWVRALPTPKEIKGVNVPANATTGRPIAGATGLNARVAGDFTGTTEQILRWTACKWGLDEDIVKAQAAVESWWRMDTLGDWGVDVTRCPPGHGLGADGRAGSCPESYGLLQVRYPYNLGAFPYAETSSAFNTDYAYAQFRDCYVGNLTWLNTVDRVGTYAAGDAWGCLGVWYSGRWHTAAADGYIAKVKDYLNRRIWTTPDFAQP